MSDLLEALTHEFIERPNAPARLAVDYFQSASKAALANTLRYHAYEPITGSLTIDRRASFDQLLSFYSLIEIASLEGVVELDVQFSKRARQHLRNETVKTYYENNYPLLLPRLLRHRLEGQPLVNPPATPSHIALARFTNFLNLTRMLDDPDADPKEWSDVEEFWWLLDGGMTEDGHNIDDLTAAFSKSSTARKALLGADDTDLYSCIRGLYQFVRFSNELQQFLSTQPTVVASTYWHHYGYWFDRMESELTIVMRRVLRQLDPQNGSSDELLRLLGRLTSGRYAWPLREAALGEPLSALVA